MNWVNKLERTKKELEKNINLEKRKLMMEKEMVSFKLSNLQKKMREIDDLEKELGVFKKEKGEVSKLEEARVSKERFIEELNERILKIKQSNEEIEKRAQESSLKLSLLENPEPACPICKKEMRYDQKVAIKNEISNRSERERALLSRNLEQLKEIERKKELSEGGLKEIERKVIAKPLIFEKVSHLEEKIEETREESKQLNELRKKEEELMGLLHEKAYAPMSQKLLKEVKKELNKNL